MNYRLTAPCLFGIEAVLKNEIIKLGYNIVKVDDGRVTFEGDAAAICRSNVWLRTAERVLLEIAEFQAFSFEELFQSVKKIPWENYVGENDKVWVTKASSIHSKLFSPSDIQSIIKKAIAERLMDFYHVNWLKEDGNEFPLRVFIKKDIVTISMDTSGDSLHKRGYREISSAAPISETLASAIIQLSHWNRDRLFADPFCGSGTLPIEAAMLGANIAPGLNREFLSQRWKSLIPDKLWSDAFEEGKSLVKEGEMNIQGFDVDFRVIKIAKENARLAGVDQYIHFQERDVKDFASNKKSGVMITNPPYGERLSSEDEVTQLYKTLGSVYKQLDTWSLSVITAYEDFERCFGKSATKKRKLYNGMIKTNLYQYIGPKPNTR